MHTDHHALEVEVSEPEHETCVVRCAGAIDIENATRFREVLGRALSAGRRRLIVDLCGVTFMDSAGVGAIVSARDHLQRGARLLVRARDGHIRMLLEMAGLGRVCNTGAPSAA